MKYSCVLPLQTYMDTVVSLLVDNSGDVANSEETSLYILNRVLPPPRLWPSSTFCSVEGQCLLLFPPPALAIIVLGVSNTTLQTVEEGH